VRIAHCAEAGEYVFGWTRAQDNEALSVHFMCDDRRAGGTTVAHLIPGERRDQLEDLAAKEKL